MSLPKVYSQVSYNGLRRYKSYDPGTGTWESGHYLSPDNRVELRFAIRRLKDCVCRSEDCEIDGPCDDCLDAADKAIALLSGPKADEAEPNMLEGKK